MLSPTLPLCTCGDLVVRELEWGRGGSLWVSRAAELRSPQSGRERRRAASQSQLVLQPWDALQIKERMVTEKSMPWFCRQSASETPLMPPPPLAVAQHTMISARNSRAATAATMHVVNISAVALQSWLQLPTLSLDKYADCEWWYDDILTIFSLPLPTIQLHT